MLFCMSIGIAWAQTPIQSSAFDASKTYRVYNNKAGEELKAWIVNGSNRGWMAAYDEKDNGQIWAFIPGEGDNANKYLLQNVKTGKYLAQVGGSNGVGAVDQNSACYYQMVWKDGDNTKVKFVSGGQANTLFNDGGGKLAGWENDDQEWFFLVEGEMLATTTVRYTFTYNDEVKGTQETEVAIGAAFPEITKAFPMGVVATKPAGVVSEENNEQTIVLTVDNSKLPFVAASDYNSIEHWYYMNIRDDGPTYMYYDASINYIKADKSAIDKKNKDIYSWAFIGNPWDGFSIVNKAAGETKVLSSPVAPSANANAEQVARMVAKQGATGNLVWTIMNPTHNNAPAGSFYVQHPTASDWAINRQGFSGGNALCYWNNRDTGSSFQIVERPMGPVAELEDLLTDANALLTTVNDNLGAKIGEYTQATADALTAAITTANGIVEAENATADDVANLQAAMDAVKVILPTVGQYYQIHSSLTAFPETKAAYSNGTRPEWKTLNEDDQSFYWQAVATADGGVAFKNAKDGKYLQGHGWNEAWTLADESTNAGISVKVFAKGENVKGYEYGLIIGGCQMHAMNHGGGTGNGSYFVGYDTNNANSASSWFIVPVEYQEFHDVTYNFVYGGDVKYSTTTSVADGAAYPAVVVPALPYGVTVGATTTPEGTVTEPTVKEFTLTVEHELPFKTATDVNNITTWYYAQMHANPNVTSYVEDNENANNNVEWADKTVAADEIDSHLWGFVGDVWTGVKMVNKGTGRAIVSTSGAAVMGDAANATAFVPVYSDNGNGAAYRDGWFCLKYPNNADHLNANGGIISSWWDDDNGSSFFLTEYKETEVVVSEAGYATLYLGQATYIPAGVEVYAVTGIEGNSATMTAVEGVLPANEGVILKNAGTYTFKKTAGATGSVEGNLLLGSVENTYVEGNAYVLGMIEGKVGLYKAMLNTDAVGGAGTTHFLNNANKAYLPMTNSEGAQALRFNFGETTGIEGVIEGTNANAVIFDLSGRRVAKMQKGIYIVNGKKVYVK